MVMSVQEKIPRCWAHSKVECIWLFGPYLQACSGCRSCPYFLLPSKAKIKRSGEVVRKIEINDDDFPFRPLLSLPPFCASKYLLRYLHHCRKCYNTRGGVTLRWGVLTKYLAYFVKLMAIWDRLQMTSPPFWSFLTPPPPLSPEVTFQWTPLKSDVTFLWPPLSPLHHKDFPATMDSKIVLT